jgi:putative DNA methylase
MSTESQYLDDDTFSPLADAPSFIETQFPVAKVSMESYKERTAKQGQTLTGLGKWWGRKPLVLVRAALLGLLMPTSNDPCKDREVFLKLMTMDRDGLHQRKSKSKSIPGARLMRELEILPDSIQRDYLNKRTSKLKRLSREKRAELQLLVFDRMPYAEKLDYCDRPEQIDGPAPEAWEEINAHLQTSAYSLQELVHELGVKRFGHRPQVGDAFCGAGSVPFEAAQLGCDAYGSDLNPVAALLTWAALNIIGGGEEVVKQVQEAQRQVYDIVDRQITEWGIEHNSLGWRADAYLYCVEVVDPETGWRVPLAPSWIIGRKSNTIAKLMPDLANKRYDIEILEGVGDDELVAADVGTVQNNRVVHPMGVNPVPMEVIRRGLRMWENRDVIPRPDDVFQERLYCIRWVETYMDAEGREHSERYYRAPTAADQAREATVLHLLGERFDEWQARGYFPSRSIEPGDETTRLQRERGWIYWHHLFTPRQLLVHGLLAIEAKRCQSNPRVFGATLLGLARCADYSSRLSRWHPRTIGDKSEQTFSNQALNTLYNFASRSLLSLESSWFLNLSSSVVDTSIAIIPEDARSISVFQDIWITDPPYADAVNYHELSEYFLAWHERSLNAIFPRSSPDSRRSLAVRGDDASFCQAMVECYSNLAAHMPDNGLQIVMFTHQDAAVWADLSLILWAAGLRVTAAWTIATETDSALKQGNYVQGTVLLVLRKRTATEPVFLDEITHEIEAEVRRQLDSMTQLDDDSDPNFGDADYQLAAYAAALRVLTAQPIHEIDPATEIQRQRAKGEVGPVEALIRSAVKIACDHLVPRGFDGELWKTLSPMERFYIKGVEVESHAEHRSGVYQELARGFGAAEYADLLASAKANETRLMTASEFGRRMLSGAGFGGSLLRQILFAIHQAAKSEETGDGLNYLKTELQADYWSQRSKVIHILHYLGRLAAVTGMVHWRKDGAAAGLLAGAVQNDHV